MTIAFSALSGLFPAASAVALVVSGLHRSRARRAARGSDRSQPYAPPAHLTAVPACPRRVPMPPQPAIETAEQTQFPTEAGATPAERRAALMSWLAFFGGGALLFAVAKLLLR